MLIEVTTLSDYLHAHQVAPNIASTITTITQVGGQISDLLRRGALADILGDIGNQNVQGEEQKKTRRYRQ